MSATMEPSWSLFRGEALDVLAGLPAKSIDAIVTDPPYGIGFRREQWDTPTAPGESAGEAFEQFTRAWAAEALRVLKPGGHLVAFGAPRTAHRLAAGIEDAGFELRDQLVWLYGTGVPKTRLHQGRASQLKPAFEPIILARRPPEGLLGRNERVWGTGRLGIDETRLTPDRDCASGRWPANVTVTHATTCTASRCARPCAVASLERSRPGASRFFYCPKPTKAERDSGCERLPAKVVRIYGPSMPRPRKNTHPTVKPVALMRWLVRLTCPNDGVVLDPFAGSGSTGIASLQEGRRFVGVERDVGFAQIARARLDHAEDTAKKASG